MKAVEWVFKIFEKYIWRSATYTTTSDLEEKVTHNLQKQTIRDAYIQENYDKDMILNDIQLFNIS